MILKRIYLILYFEFISADLHNLIIHMIIIYLWTVVPMDWRGACTVPLYKGQGDNYVFSNSRGISLLSVVGKLYGRVLIKRVGAGTEYCNKRGAIWA